MEKEDELKVVWSREVAEIGERFHVCEYPEVDSKIARIALDYLGTDGKTVKLRVVTSEVEGKNEETIKNKMVLEFPLDKNKCNTYYPQTHWKLPQVQFHVLMNMESL